MDTPPPGGGRNTVTVAVPAFASSAAGTSASSSVPEVNRVTRSTSLAIPWLRQRTIELLLKLVPFTVMVTAAPTRPLLGKMLMVVGAVSLTENA